MQRLKMRKLRIECIDCKESYFEQKMFKCLKYFLTCSAFYIIFINSKFMDNALCKLEI